MNNSRDALVNAQERILLQALQDLSAYPLDWNASNWAVMMTRRPHR